MYLVRNDQRRDVKKSPGGSTGGPVDRSHENRRKMGEQSGDKEIIKGTEG